MEHRGLRPGPCDYAYVEVNDGDRLEVAIPGTITNAAEDNGIDGDPPAPGRRRRSTCRRTPARRSSLRLRYRPTAAACRATPPTYQAGVFVDDISIAGGTVGRRRDQPERLDARRLLARSAHSVTRAYDNYYIASHRDYVSFDKYLQSGPYNFGFANTKPDFVEHFPYQDGLLVSYWDTSQADNNTSAHPGEGLILPVDANPARSSGWTARSGGRGWPGTTRRSRLEKSDSFTLHLERPAASYIRGSGGPAAVPRQRVVLGRRASRRASVKVPNNGTNIKVLNQQGTSMEIRVSKRKLT